MAGNQCTCGKTFRDGEDFRDHMPCPGSAMEQSFAALENQWREACARENTLRLAAEAEAKQAREELARYLNTSQDRNATDACTGDWEKCWCDTCEIRRLRKRVKDLETTAKRQCACLFPDPHSWKPDVECAMHATLRERFQKLRERLAKAEARVKELEEKG